METTPRLGGGAPRVSVLMAVRDAERYVAAATRSILAQTFADFEFLIVDDGSTDGSRGVVLRHAAEDPRIRFHARENRGLAASLNELAGMARGEYLARMDADDVSLPDRFARQVAALDARPEIDVLGSAVVQIDAAGRRIFTLRPPCEHARIDAANLEGQVSILHPTVMMRKAAAEAAGLYDPAYEAAQDLDLWLRMAERGGLANLDTAFVEYRILETSVSGSRGGRQAAFVARACRSAWSRRGLPERPILYRQWRPDRSRASRREFALRWGWQAWNAGNVGTSRHYFLKAVRLDPFSPSVWRALAVGLVRSPNEGRE